MFIVRLLHISAIHMVGRLEERDIGQEIKEKYNTPMNDLWMDDVQPQ